MDRHLVPKAGQAFGPVALATVAAFLCWPQVVPYLPASAQAPIHAETPVGSNRNQGTSAEIYWSID